MDRLLWSEFVAISSPSRTWELEAPRDEFFVVKAGQGICSFWSRISSSSKWEEKRK